MITKEKLKIYIKYRSDIDSFARTSKKNEENIISTKDWYLIDELLQDLKLLKSDVISEAFKKEITIKLKDNCENNEVIKQMEAIGI